MRLSSWTLTAVVSLLAAVSGCTCSTGPCVVSPPAVLDAGIWTDHSHVHIQFVQTMPAMCEDQTKIQAVDPQISDEENVKLPAEGGFTQTKDDLNVPVTVDFEATDPGWYHAAVRIEPGLATVQFPILVTRDRSDAGVLQLARSCGRPFLTGKGTPLCEGQPVHLDGSPAEFTADEVAVVDDVVWSWSGSSVQRWEDTGSALVANPSGTATADDGSGALVAGADGGEVFTLGTANVNRIAVRNGALVTLSQIPLGRAIRYRYGLATADTLFAISPQSLVANTTSGKTTVCAYSLAGDLVTFTDQCQDVPGMALGVADGAFWTRDEASVRAWIPGGGQLHSAGTALLPPFLSSDPYVVLGSPPAPVVPVTSSFWLAPRFDGEHLFYDRYRSAAGYTFYSGSPTAFSERSGNGTRIYPR